MAAGMNHATGAGDAPALLARDAGRPAARRGETVLAIVAGGALQAVVWVVLIQLFWIQRLGYAFHQLSDTLLYVGYASRWTVLHRLPYVDFRLEYPPLALPLFLLPPSTGSVAAYERWFSVEMIVLCVITALATAALAASYWRLPARTLAAGLAFAACTLAAGAIVANRYDIAVGLAIAVALLLLAGGRWTAAGAVLGLGFALKLTPLVLLPLVLVVAGRKAAPRVAIAFAAAAALPFVPFLFSGLDGLAYVFAYHAQRPLQIESLLATPYLLGHLVGREVPLVASFGSTNIGGGGAAAMAALSPWLALLGMTAVYCCLWRLRTRLRERPAEVAFAALTVVLVGVSLGKVLSPQFLVWVLPLVALVLVSEERGQRLVGVLCLAAVVLTQIEFPRYYLALVDLQPGAIVLVAARNALLASATLVGVIVVLKEYARERARGG